MCKIQIYWNALLEIQQVSWRFSNGQSYAPFLIYALENSHEWLLEKFVLTETVASWFRVDIFKDQPTRFNIQKPADYFNGEFAAKLHIAEYKKKFSYKESKVLILHKEVLVLLATLTSHFMEKSPRKSGVAKFVICFDPNYMANMEDSTIKSFGLLC